MEIFVVWVLCGIAAAVIASNKGRSGCGWLILGFLLGPFGILFAFIASPDKEEEEKAAVSSGEMKKCPFCAELIKGEAKVCRYCQRDQP